MLVFERDFGEASLFVRQGGQVQREPHVSNTSPPWQTLFGKQLDYELVIVHKLGEFPGQHEPLAALSPEIKRDVRQHFFRPSIKTKHIFILQGVILFTETL